MEKLFDKSWVVGFKTNKQTTRTSHNIQYISSLVGLHKFICETCQYK
jgi:hypothetical protein